MRLIGKKRFWGFGAILFLAVAGLYCNNNRSTAFGDRLIVTRIPLDIDLASGNSGIDGKYLPGSQLVAIIPGGDLADGDIISQDFYSANSPDVSYDGTGLLFSAQQKEHDTWQVYRMDLNSRQVVPVTHSNNNCTDPAWLPDGRIVYSMQEDNGKTGSYHNLYVADPENDVSERITFHPNTNVSSSVTFDGRIVFATEQAYPEKGKTHYQAMRTDGTKSELFYKDDGNYQVFGRPREAIDGRVYFILNDGNAGLVASVDFGNPFNSVEYHSLGSGWHFRSVFPTQSGEVYGTAKNAGDKPYGLYLISSMGSEENTLIYGPDDYQVIDVVAVERRDLPMKLPTIVDESKQRGTMLCLDASQSTIDVGDDLPDSQTSRVQVLGVDGMLGEIPVEKDGSFYFEVDVNTPVRFQTVNEAGDVLRGPSAWIWVRPNERRSCVGCHEDRQMAPANRLPEAIYAGMYSLPEGEKSEPIAWTEK